MKVTMDVALPDLSAESVADARGIVVQAFDALMRKNSGSMIEQEVRVSMLTDAIYHAEFSLTTPAEESRWRAMRAARELH